MIELSVVLPMYRAKHIGWLPFESLIRQTGINFEWELIIAEELISGPFGEENILKYKPKLEELGCVNFKYIGLKQWITLSEKMHLLINSCHVDSKIFVRHAADFYSAPLRLSTHYDVFENNPDVGFHLPKKVIYYYFNEDKFVIHDPHRIKNKRQRIDDVIGNAYRLELVRKIPKIKRRKGIDGFIFAQADKYSQLLKGVPYSSKNQLINIHFDKTDNWKYGLSTHGLNNICTGRTAKMKIPKHPFYNHVFDETTIPIEVMSRLRACRNFAKRWRIGVFG